MDNNKNNHDDFILIFDNVSASYEDKVDIIKNIHFSLKNGESIAIIGSSGSGKSTLLKTINCSLDINKGSIYFKGKNIRSLNKKQIRLLRRNISYIFQDFNLIDRKLVIENTLLGLLGKKSFFSTLLGIYSKDEYELAFKSLTDVDMENKFNLRADQLSGGQKQRVAIARSLVQGASLIIADEPVSALDPIISEKILKLFQKLNREKNISIIASLHDVHLAQKYFKRIIAIKDGSIIFDDSSDKLNEKLLNTIYT